MICFGTIKPINALNAGGLWRDSSLTLCGLLVTKKCEAFMQVRFASRFCRVVSSHRNGKVSENDRRSRDQPLELEPDNSLTDKFSDPHCLIRRVDVSL